MAGEWIAYDLGLPDKPEVQELIDLTGEPVEVVTFRLLRLWGWAAMNTTDGRARMTVPRLVRTCGADADFWRAVEAVGWLEIDETDASVAIPGWDRRFSQAAKSRLQHADRSAAHEDKRRRAGAPGAQAPERPAHERRRGEERREEVPPPPRDAALGDTGAGEAWLAFREIWNAKGRAGNRKEWKPPAPPPGWADRIVEPGWYDQAVEAIERIPRCRYFETPVTMYQVVLPHFVSMCLGGQYDSPKGTKGGGPTPERSVSGFSGDAAARFEATKRKLVESLKATD
jgi:hypothetical protein